MVAQRFYVKVGIYDKRSVDNILVYRAVIRRYREAVVDIKVIFGAYRATKYR